jgi:aryl-alcohol dehydrogenase-like predicted oxidoreductase
MASKMRNFVLGGAQLGRGYGFYEKVPELSSSRINDLLGAAIKLGIAEIDLAQNYAGVFEKLSEQPFLSQFELSTKIKYRKGNNSETIEELKTSLKKTSKEIFQNVLVHNWHELEIEDKIGSLNFLQSLKDDGICQKIGLSVYETKELIDGVEETNFIQAPLSFFNRTFLNSQKSLALQSLGVVFQARSIFHQGTLLNQGSMSELFPEELRIFTEYCSKNSLTYLEGALSVYDDQNLFTSLVVGVASEDQLREITQTRVLQGILSVPGQKSDFPIKLTDPRLWT